MRALIHSAIFLCALICIASAEVSSEPIELYRAAGVAGATDSDQYASFTMPSGLRAATLFLTFTLPGTGSVSVAAYEASNQAGDNFDHAKRTVLYPAAGAWDIHLHGNRAFYSLTITIRGYPDIHPLSRQAGTFSAIMGTDHVIFTLGATGAFTGKFYQSGVPFSFRGVFDANGDAVSNSPVPYNIHIDPVFNTTLGANLITGTVSNESFTAYHAAYSSHDTAREEGRYTALLPAAQPGSATVPPGAGFGAFRVGRTGALTLAGKLADGTRFSAGGPLIGGPAGNNQFLIYQTLKYAPKGLLSGPLTFESLTDSAWDGPVRWIKPQTTGDYNPAAFDTTLQFSGNLYGPRARGLMDLDFPPQSENASITITGGGLNTDITETATLAANNVVTISGANLNKVKLVLNPAAGTLSGDFTHPVSGKVTAITGVLYQNLSAAEAAGFFIGPVLNGTGLDGSVTMLPQ